MYNYVNLFWCHTLQELNETRTRTEITMEEVDGRLSRDYENRLAEALKQMREDYEYQIRSTREETEIVWLNKVNNYIIYRKNSLYKAAVCLPSLLRLC